MPEISLAPAPTVSQIPSRNRYAKHGDRAARTRIKPGWIYFSVRERRDHEGRDKGRERDRLRGIEAATQSELAHCQVRYWGS